MPELPEVEITARLLDGALKGARVESALAPGINALKTFAPPLSALEGQEVLGVSRRGKKFVLGFSGELMLLVHLMSAGRLQLYDKRAGPRDRTSRVLLRVRDADDGGGDAGGAERELRLREFGSKQAAWVKLLAAGELEQDESIAGLGPEAWPDTPELGGLLDVPRPLHALLRDQHTIAGIGRSWVDEILWEARLSPYKRGADLDEAELATLRGAVAATLGGALESYEQTVALPIPDKLPMPLRVHRHEGEPCPRCGTKLEAVHFEDYVIAYCPTCQTEGKVLKDRRLSRLLR
ncbi:MAG TPA: DNA-formamidopyrimidine glycosylase family protein [Solirubrobacteraceae bacterium]|jgi:formamidopyrimidine-DNA glycosylase